jgi:tellurite resistance protein
MARWGKTLEGSIYRVTQARTEEEFLKNFFENKAFIPKTEKEKQEYEDFSFVSSAMALLIYIARADGKIDQAEKDTIMNELLFQLEQRHFEYKVLAEEFGQNEMEILNKLFHRFQEELENEVCNLDKIIRIIDMIYQKNPYKRKFLIRLCYYVAHADRKFAKEEFEAIRELSQKLGIEDKERDRIEHEVQRDLELHKV